MSGSYRLQPPSPFPYSGGSRLEQSLVPALQGPNASSMIGYALGAQLQRQADQMGYESEMADYNLTAQREGERARQELLADRAEQRNNAITAALVNRHGAAMVPEGYTLTPEQRRIGTEFANANINLIQNRAEAADRSNTGGGTPRLDPLVRAEFTGLLTEERQVQGALRRLADPAIRANAIARATAGMYRPAEREAAIRQIDEGLAAERRTQETRLAELQQRRAGLANRTPGAAPQSGTQPQAPVQGAPSVAPPSGEGTPPSAAPATGQAPRSTSEALQRQLITPEQLARARATGQIVRIEPDGTIVTRNAAGEQRVPKQ